MLTIKGRELILDFLMLNKSQIAPPAVRLAQAFSGSDEAHADLADFTECDFGGYADYGLTTMPSALPNGSDQAETDTPTLTWTADGTGTLPQTIVAVYVVVKDSTSAVTVVFVWLLATPVVINSAGDTFQRVIDFLCDNLT